LAPVTDGYPFRFPEFLRHSEALKHPIFPSLFKKPKIALSSHRSDHFRKLRRQHRRFFAIANFLAPKLHQKQSKLDKKNVLKILSES
jgi:hypothetical protein